MDLLGPTYLGSILTETNIADGAITTLSLPQVQ